MSSTRGLLKTKKNIAPTTTDSKISCFKTCRACKRVHNYIFGKETDALIDSGSMVTTVSEEFYKSIVPQPELKGLDNLGLSLQGPDGRALPYISYIEARIEISFHAAAIDIPVLVVPSTEYNTHVPVIVGTNLIRIARENGSEDGIPQAWHDAFLSLQNAFVGLVKSTN